MNQLKPSEQLYWKALQEWALQIGCSLQCAHEATPIFTFEFERTSGVVGVVMHENKDAMKLWIDKWAVYDPHVKMLREKMMYFAKDLMKGEE